MRQSPAELKKNNPRFADVVVAVLNNRGMSLYRIGRVFKSHGTWSSAARRRGAAAIEAGARLKRAREVATEIEAEVEAEFGAQGSENPNGNPALTMADLRCHLNERARVRLAQYAKEVRVGELEAAGAILSRALERMPPPKIKGDVEELA